MAPCLLRRYRLTSRPRARPRVPSPSRLPEASAKAPLAVAGSWRSSPAASPPAIGVAAAIHVPQVDAIASFSPKLVTQIYDRDGTVAFASYARERRLMLDQEEIPPLLRDAMLAAEDGNFFRHGGIDALGIVRSVLVNLRSGRHAQGASTITMQLARKLFLTDEKSWRRKISEAFLAVELEKQLSKQQILTMYCNVVFLGHGNYGMESAARAYFGHGVGELTLPEAATLAGIVQRPSQFSPFRHPDRVVARRNYVLNRMLAEQFISEADHRSAVASPLAVVRTPRQPELGPFFAEEVRQHLEATYGVDRLYHEGLQVQTTLDLRHPGGGREGAALRACCGWIIGAATVDRSCAPSGSTSRATPSRRSPAGTRCPTPGSPGWSSKPASRRRASGPRTGRSR